MRSAFIQGEYIMKRSRQERELKPDAEEAAVSLALPLSDLDRTMLPVAGGTAANLGELIRAGFSVPAGLWVTTAPYARPCPRAGRDTYPSRSPAPPQGG